MNEIKEWCVAADAWVAPECRGNPSIAGVANVPGLTDNKEKGIITSSIDKVNGRRIKTKSGSYYTLVGPPNQFFLDFLKDKGMSYDEENPLAEMIVKGYIKVS